MSDISRCFMHLSEFFCPKKNVQNFTVRNFSIVMYLQAKSNSQKETSIFSVSSRKPHFFQQFYLQSNYSSLEQGIMGAYSRGLFICKNRFLGGGLFEGNLFGGGGLFEDLRYSYFPNKRPRSSFFEKFSSPPPLLRLQAY